MSSAAKSLTLALALVGGASASDPSPLIPPRTYVPGELSRYQMTGDNHGWQYTITATDITKRDATGSFYEEISWSNLSSNAPMTLSPDSLAFRERLSLDPKAPPPSIPDLGHVQPALIGPITDLLTIYSDLWLSQRSHLSRIGETIHIPHNQPNSWADGQRVLLGQDAIDFEFKVQSVNPEHHTVTLLARHVPPQHPKIETSAAWMQQPVADTPNNWVEVEHQGAKYIAQVGKETFDNELVIDSRNGSILSAKLHNPVTLITRECDDPALEHCTTPHPGTILREVSLQLLPNP